MACRRRTANIRSLKVSDYTSMQFRVVSGRHNNRADG